MFDREGRYYRDLNRYLRERATLDWHPGGRSDYPADRTLTGIAERLKNFIDWCGERNIDRSNATYEDVLRYQREQISGAWSTKGRLRASTANQRADEATNFLTWAAYRGLRDTFHVKRFFAGRARLGGYGTLMARAGRAKANETAKSTAAFVLPKQSAIKAWLKAVRAKRGYAKYLACRLILETGMRREEVARLDVEAWPAREAIDAASQLAQQTVPMEITITKGAKPRTVRIPTQFADRVRNWIDGKRLNYTLRYFKLKRQRTQKLFLSDNAGAQGRPISAQTIYRCFTEVQPRSSSWSPHKGRHAFACYFLLEALAAEAGSAGLASKGAGWIVSRGEFWIDMLRRQFGHVSRNTTEIYLRWVATSCGIAEIASSWHRYLDDAEDAE